MGTPAPRSSSSTAFGTAVMSALLSAVNTSGTLKSMDGSFFVSGQKNAAVDRPPRRATSNNVGTLMLAARSRFVMWKRSPVTRFVYRLLITP